MVKIINPHLQAEATSTHTDYCCQSNSCGAPTAFTPAIALAEVVTTTNAMVYGWALRTSATTPVTPQLYQDPSTSQPFEADKQRTLKCDRTNPSTSTINIISGQIRRSNKSKK